MRPSLAAAAALATAGAALIAFGEIEAWRASRADYPTAPGAGPTDGRDVVLVLGFRSREDGRLNALQAWRTRIAVRSAPPGAQFIFTGGAVRGVDPESVVMARHGIQHLRISPGDVAIESRATTTRENLAFSLPWLRAARTIRIASNTAHARRARRYLRHLDPALHARLRRTRDFLPLELGPLRLALTFYDVVAGRVAARREAEAPAPHAAEPAG